MVLEVANLAEAFFAGQALKQPSTAPRVFAHDFYNFVAFEFAYISASLFTDFDLSGLGGAVLYVTHLLVSCCQIVIIIFSHVEHYWAGLRLYLGLGDLLMVRLGFRLP
jgi:hypothetical protein